MQQIEVKTIWLIIQNKKTKLNITTTKGKKERKKITHVLLC